MLYAANAKTGRGLRRFVQAGETVTRGPTSQQPREETGRPHPIIRPDLIDSRGNLRATDIGITCQGGDTFLHGVRVADRRKT